MVLSMVSRRTMLRVMGLAAISPATQGASCAVKALKWVSKAGDIVTVVKRALVLVEGGKDLWFDARPDDELEKDITAAAAATQEALSVVEDIGKASGNYTRGQQQEAENDLLRAYDKLYKLLEMIPGFLEADGTLAEPPVAGDGAGHDDPKLLHPDELAAEFDVAA